MKKAAIRALFCITLLCAPVTTQSQDDYDTDVERTTEVTVQTPWLYVNMLSDDPFVQVTLGCATLMVVVSIVLVGHHLYTSAQS